MGAQNSLVAIEGSQGTDCCSERNCLLGYLNSNSRRDSSDSPSRVSQLSPAVHRRTIIHKGERLFAQGDSFRYFYQVRSGSFKSYITDDKGDWQVTGFHFSGDVLGLDGLNSDRHIYTVEALETCCVCSLLFHAVEKAPGQDRGRFYRRLISTLSSSGFRQHHSLMVLGRMHAEQRLANFLLDISAAMHARGGSEMEFNLTMARYDIANYLGLAVETLSRLFKRLQEDGLIQVQRQYVRILDIEGLRFVLTGEHRFSGLQNIA